MYPYIDTEKGPMNLSDFDKWAKEQDTRANAPTETWFTLHYGPGDRGQAADFRLNIGDKEGGLFDRLEKEGHLIKPGEPYIRLNGHDYNIADGDREVLDLTRYRDISPRYTICNLQNIRSMEIRQAPGSTPRGILDYLKEENRETSDYMYQTLKPYYDRQKKIQDEATKDRHIELNRFNGFVKTESGKVMTATNFYKKTRVLRPDSPAINYEVRLKSGDGRTQYERRVPSRCIPTKNGVAYTPASALEEQRIREERERDMPYSGLTPEVLSEVRTPIADRKDLDITNEIYGPGKVNVVLKAKGLNASFLDGRAADRKDQYFLLDGDQVIGSSNNRQELAEQWNLQMEKKEKTRAPAPAEKEKTEERENNPQMRMGR